MSQLEQQLKKTGSYSTDNVVDQQAYDQWQQVLKHPYLNGERIIQTSDPNVVVDTLATYHSLLKKVSHLPKPERARLFAINKASRLLNSKAAVLKRKAYGIRQDTAFGFIESILDPRRSEILEMMGRFFTDSEIHPIVSNEWGLDVNLTTIANFRSRNIEAIKELQEQHKRDFDELRLVHKKSRLEEYTYLYITAKQQYERTLNREDRKELRELLYHIKREVEGDTLNVKGDLQVSIEHTLHVHIQQEILEKMNINALILSRIAVKANANPLLLLYKLQNSYYSKFTGLRPLQDNESIEDEPVYPSNTVYDIDKIAALNISYEANNQSVKDKLQAHMDTSSTGSSLKTLLLKQIAQQQDKVKKGQLTVLVNQTNKQP